MRDGLKVGLLFTVAGAAAYLQYRDVQSIVATAVWGGVTLLFLLSVVKPMTITAGRTWLQVVRGRRKAPDWVCTTELDSLECTSSGGRYYLEMRDQHGRRLTVAVRDLRSNDLLYALVMSAVRASYRRGMRANELAVSWLALDQQNPDVTIARDGDGRSVTTYFAFYRNEDGPNRPFAVVRRSPGDVLPTDEVYGAGLRWVPLGYALHFDASKIDGGYVQISESRAAQLTEDIRRRVTPLHA